MFRCVLFYITVGENFIGAPKVQIIMMPFNYSFSNISITKMDFSLLLLVMLSLLIVSALFLESFLCFSLLFIFYFRYCSSNYHNSNSWHLFSLLMAIAISFLLLLAIAFKIEKAITIRRAITEKKLWINVQNNKAKELRATNFSIAKLEEQ